MRTCPVCAAHEHQPILELCDIPAVCNALWPDAASARTAAAGDLHLVACARCGVLFNRAFDPELVAYTPGYENSLHFSPTFRRYADGVARRLVDRYDLRGTRVAEIGSGSGEFLSRLCELGANQGLGFDPSHQPEPEAATSQRAEVVAAPFPVDEVVAADLVVAQHVLEHVPDPGGTLDAVRRAVRPSRRERCPVFYLEVPDAAWMIEHGAMWDVIYEHCIYFTASTLRRLLEDTGFAVRDSAASFAGQYLWAEASPAADTPPHRNRAEPASESATCRRDELLARAAAFGRQYREAVASWRKAIGDMAADGPVAVWGAGSKGVAFVNAVDHEGRIRVMVDVNPRKQGRYTPRTGHRVASPAELAAEPPAHVLVMNPVYAKEVRATLAAHGLESPHVATVSGPG